MNVDPEHLEDMLIELPETQAKQFDAAIESAFRFGDFDAIYRLVYEEELPVDYQVKCSYHGQIDLNKMLKTVKGTHQTSKWTP